MRQITVILWDSYKLLLARKLFWISLGLSLIVAMLYASIGFNNQEISILFGLYEIDLNSTASNFIDSKSIYNSLFSKFIFPWWLGFFSIVLALISVCPIFPEFMRPGSIDIALSKPINRWFLFIVKYIGCLLFVSAQVLVFCLIVFIAQGFRIDTWNLQLFLAVPLLIFVFSMIFCIAVLISVWTKSTIFSMLIAMLLWGCSVIVEWSESLVHTIAYPPTELLENRSIFKRDLEVNSKIINVYNVIEGVSIPIPKTRGTLSLLKNYMNISEEDGYESKIKEFNDIFGRSTGRTKSQKEIPEQRLSAFYILGSSFAFQLVVLSIAGWGFSRKDF